ncbi:hypothetical protein [Microbacterium sp. No. 7]|uniref:hypothetical protein n=1 Tax=Microbacterium sp. No. 7 TaxID=1714373 RepID=UPI0006CF7230|nr:hypothetical protein [Microbacterium sp. No. 7]ALJ20396.1 hypothetical protein AOA12_10935 [Microbacterium sp. No. 7]
MSIETEIVVTIATVDVADDYRIEVTVTDIDHWGLESTVALTWGQAEQLIGELQRALVDAEAALREDRPESVSHGFDADGPVHPECVAGKCGNCDGQVLTVHDTWAPCGHPCHTAGAS